MFIGMRLNQLASYTFIFIFAVTSMKPIRGTTGSKSAWNVTFEKTFCHRVKMGLQPSLDPRAARAIRYSGANSRVVGKSGFEHLGILLSVCML